jgi:hypothetical protein
LSENRSFLEIEFGLLSITTTKNNIVITTFFPK